MSRTISRPGVAALAAGWVSPMTGAATVAATGTLVGRVTHADSGKPIPARLSLRAADGTHPADRMPGCHVAAELKGDATFDAVEVGSGPRPIATGSTAVAAVLLDAERVAPGDVLHVAAIVRHEAEGGPGPNRLPSSKAGSVYDPARPTGFGALRKFGAFEAGTANAAGPGDGYRMVVGKLTVPPWGHARPRGRD